MLIESISIQNKSNLDISLSRSDLSLCASNVLGFAADYILKNSNISNPLELLNKTPQEVALYIGASGVSFFAHSSSTKLEAFASIRSLSDVKSAIPGIALTAAKMWASQKMLSQPVLSPLLLAANAHGTYAVASRAFTQLSKCWNVAQNSKENNSLTIAANVAVHSINASSSAYRTYNTFQYCMEYLNWNAGSQLSFRGTTLDKSLTPEQKMDKIIQLSEQNQLETLCPKSDIKKCYRELSSELHPDKQSVLRDKANTVQSILNDFFGQTNNKLIARDILERAKTAEQSGSLILDIERFTVVPNPCSVLPDTCSEIAKKQEAGTIKYPYQVRDIIDKTVAPLKKKLSKAADALDDYTAILAKVVACASIIQSAKNCEDEIETTGRYGEECTDKLFEDAENCEITIKEAPSLEDYLHAGGSALEASLAKNVVLTAERVLKTMTGCPGNAWV